MPNRPWDYHADLSLDRLQLVAKVLADTRRRTLLQHEPLAGDGNWSLGCRIYERSCEMLTRAGERLWPWLQIVQPRLQFIFTIGEVPLRFWHGDAEHPMGTRLLAVDMEARQLDMAFGDARSDLVWRVIVESNETGEADRVLLLGASSDGTVECQFLIPPIDDAVALWDPLTTAVGRGVELAPAVVTLKQDERSGDTG